MLLWFGFASCVAMLFGQRYSRHPSLAPPLAASCMRRPRAPNHLEEHCAASEAVVMESRQRNDLHSTTAWSTEKPATSVGLRFDRESAEARAVLLTFQDSPLESTPQVQRTEAESLPHDLLCLFDKVENDETDAATRESLATELTAIATRLIQQLLPMPVRAMTSPQTNQSDSVDDVLAIGIHGSGVWLRDRKRVQAYSELIDASRLAEQFGKTIIDSFPSRDIAQGGNGGPVECHGLWVMLADRSSGTGCHYRGLLDVAQQATHFCLISPMDRHRRPSAAMAMDVCVGSRFWSELAANRRELSAGVRDGSLAAGGSAIPELAELWHATHGIAEGWSVNGVSPLPLLYALRESAYGTCTLQDQLATATQFVAHRIENHIKHIVPAATPVGELFIMGEGSKNAQLMRLLHEAIPEVSIRRLEELGQDRTIYAAAVAALALLNIWQVPVPSSNHGVPRLLGRITPGNPNNWQRVLRAMTSNVPWLLPLREAI